MLRATAVLLLLVPLASAASTITLHIEMTDAGFAVTGEPGLNPVLFLAPGTHVHVIVRNNGTRPENFHVGAPINRSTPFAQRPGESAQLDFDTPADLIGDVPYFSDGDPTNLASVLRVGNVPPIVRITDPGADGASVAANLTLHVSVQRFTLDPYPYSTEDQAGRGHLVALVDGANASGPTDRTTLVLSNLAPGTHLIRVQLVQHDGTPVDPPAYADRIVHALADPTPAPTPPTASTVTTAAAPANGIPAPAVVPLLTLVALTALSFRRRR